MRQLFLFSVRVSRPCASFKDAVSAEQILDHGAAIAFIEVLIEIFTHPQNFRDDLLSEFACFFVSPVCQIGHDSFLERLSLGRFPFSRAAAAFLSDLLRPPFLPSLTAAGSFILGKDSADACLFCAGLVRCFGLTPIYGSRLLHVTGVVAIDRSEDNLIIFKPENYSVIDVPKYLLWHKIE